MSDHKYTFLQKAYLKASIQAAQLERDKLWVSVVKTWWFQGTLGCLLLSGPSDCLLCLVLHLGLLSLWFLQHLHQVHNSILRMFDETANVQELVIIKCPVIDESSPNGGRRAPVPVLRRVCFRLDMSSQDVNRFYPINVGYENTGTFALELKMVVGYYKKVRKRLHFGVTPLSGGIQSARVVCVQLRLL